MFTPPLPSPAKEQFYAAVWLLARQVPAGKVCTYGQIAAWIPIPPGVSEADHAAYRARWAGSAMAACPADVPWQRIINSQGKISERPGTEKQRALLEAEGIAFDPRGKIDLKRYAWAGPSPDWLREHGLIVPPEAENPAQPSLF